MGVFARIGRCRCKVCAPTAQFGTAVLQLCGSDSAASLRGARVELGASATQPGARRGRRRADGTLFQILDATAEHSANRIRTGEGFRVGSGEAFHSLGERVQLGGERNERGGLDPPPSFSLCPRHASPSTTIDNSRRRSHLRSYSRQLLLADANRARSLGCYEAYGWPPFRRCGRPCAPSLLGTPRHCRDASDERFAPRGHRAHWMRCFAYAIVRFLARG